MLLKILTFSIDPKGGVRSAFRVATCAGMPRTVGLCLGPLDAKLVRAKPGKPRPTQQGGADSPGCSCDLTSP